MKWKKNGMLSGLILIVTAACANGLPSVPDKSDNPTLEGERLVNGVIDELVDSNVYPFLYVRVERLNGELVYEHEAHNSDYSSVPIAADSWLRLWSMSKQVTIATVLRLEELGILSRDDLVYEYIPEFRDLKLSAPNVEGEECVPATQVAPHQMTIEDLLNHTEGFYYPYTDNMCLNSAMKTARLPEAGSSNELISRISRLPLSDSSDGKYEYGIGTTVLSLVAERATDKRFNSLVSELITGPIGIESELRYKLPQNAQTPPRLTGIDGELRPASGVDLDIFGGPLPRYDQEYNLFLGGEGMVGTTRAYAKFLRMLGGYGEFEHKRILSEDTIRDWFSPKTQLENPYGYNGFNIWVANGTYDNLPSQKPGLLIGGGYEGTAFWIDVDSGYVGLIMSQVHQAPSNGVDEISRLRGLIYQEILEPAQ